MSIIIFNLKNRNGVVKYIIKPISYIGKAGEEFLYDTF